MGEAPLQGAPTAGRRIAALVFLALFSFLSLALPLFLAQSMRRANRAPASLQG